MKHGNFYGCVEGGGGKERYLADGVAVDLRLRSILLGFAGKFAGTLLSITAAFSENILPCGGWFNASPSNLC